MHKHPGDEAHGQKSSIPERVAQIWRESAHRYESSSSLRAENVRKSEVESPHDRKLKHSSRALTPNLAHDRKSRERQAAKDPDLFQENERDAARERERRYAARKDREDARYERKLRRHAESVDGRKAGSTRSHGKTHISRSHLHSSHGALTANGSEGGSYRGENVQRLRHKRSHRRKSSDDRSQNTQYVDDRHGKRTESGRRRRHDGHSARDFADRDGSLQGLEDSVAMDYSPPHGSAKLSDSDTIRQPPIENLETAFASRPAEDNRQRIWQAKVESRRDPAEDSDVGKKSPLGEDRQTPITQQQTEPIGQLRAGCTAEDSCSLGSYSVLPSGDNPLKGEDQSAALPPPEDAPTASIDKETSSICTQDFSGLHPYLVSPHKCDEPSHEVALEEAAMELGELRGQFVVLHARYLDHTRDHHHVSTKLRESVVRSQHALRHGAEELHRSEETVEQLRSELAIASAQLTVERRRRLEVAGRPSLLSPTSCASGRLSVLSTPTRAPYVGGDALALREKRLGALEKTLLHLDEERKRDAARQNEICEELAAANEEAAQQLSARESLICAKEVALVGREEILDMRESANVCEQEEYAMHLNQEKERQAAEFEAKRNQLVAELGAEKAQLAAGFEKQSERYYAEAERAIRDLRATVSYYERNATLSQPPPVLGGYPVGDLFLREEEVRRSLAAVATCLQIPSPHQDALSLAAAVAHHVTRHWGDRSQYGDQSVYSASARGTPLDEFSSNQTNTPAFADQSYLQPSQAIPFSTHPQCFSPSHPQFFEVEESPRRTLMQAGAPSQPDCESGLACDRATIEAAHAFTFPR